MEEELLLKLQGLKRRNEELKAAASIQAQIDELERENLELSKTLNKKARIETSEKDIVDALILDSVSTAVDSSAKTKKKQSQPNIRKSWGIQSQVASKAGEPPKTLMSRSSVANPLSISASTNSSSEIPLLDKRINNKGKDHRQSYSNEVKMKALQMHEEKQSIEQISDALKIPYPTLSKWLQTDAAKDKIRNEFLISGSSKRHGQKSKVSLSLYAVVPTEYFTLTFNTKLISIDSDPNPQVILNAAHNWRDEED